MGKLQVDAASEWWQFEIAAAFWVHIRIITVVHQTSGKIMTLSKAWLTALYRSEIEDRILNDHRTTPTTFLGWSRKSIFEDVIVGGQADFDQPVGHLSASDRALLYAKYNQTRHIDELCYAFNQLFGGAGYGDPIVFDLGCGPFTAGLSLANTLGKDISFNYYGVDCYKSMQTLGMQMATAARSCNELHPMTRYQFVNDLDEISFDTISGKLTIFIASYLLASPSIDPILLAQKIRRTHESASLGPAAVLYTNSARPEARQKFPLFKQTLEAAGYIAVTDTTELFTATSKKPTNVHYALFFKPADSNIKRNRAI